MKQKILIAVSRCNPQSVKRLEPTFEVILNKGKKPDRERLLALASGCTGIVAGDERYSRDVLVSLTPGLRVISRFGTGLDSIDLEAARELKIEIRNTPGATTIAVAEYTVGLLLGLSRRIGRMDAQLREGVWEEYLGHNVNEKRVGIIGLGRIGKRVAEILKVFGADIVTYHPRPERIEEWCREHGATVARTLEELLQTSDIILLHVPLTDESRGMIGGTELRLMKRTALLVNVARGGVVDESALHSVLSEGTIAGAAIDVFTEEPYNGPLLKLENCLVTPHAASVTFETRALMAERAIDNLLSALGE